MKCNATIAVVGKIMAYETCGIPKILIRIRYWCTLQNGVSSGEIGTLPTYCSLVRAQPFHSFPYVSIMTSFRVTSNDT